MRPTVVEESCRSRFEARLGDRSGLFQEQLERVHVGSARCSTRTASATSSGVLSNVNTRGICAKSSSGTFDQLLTSEHTRPCRDRAGTGQRVEFAIRPARRAAPMCRYGCPIDAKFPQDVYSH